MSTARVSEQFESRVLRISSQALVGTLSFEQHRNTFTAGTLHQAPQGIDGRRVARPVHVPDHVAHDVQPRRLRCRHRDETGADRLAGTLRPLEITMIVGAVYGLSLIHN